MSLQQIFIGHKSAYKIDSADFDGTNDLAKRGGGLTGAADGKRFTLSTWFRLDGGNGSELSILAGARSVGSATTDFEVFRNTANQIGVAANAPGGGSTTLFGASTSTFTSGATWHQLITSIDMANSAGSLIYVDDSDVGFSGSAFVNQNMDFTLGDWIIGAIGDSTLKFNGCLAELWFDTTWMDLTVTANRRKFRSAAGQPVFLGTQGQIPTGSQPLIYCSLPTKGLSVASFATNRGSGGGFTITGALDIGSSSPSD